MEPFFTGLLAMPPQAMTWALAVLVELSAAVIQTATPTIAADLPMVRSFIEPLLVRQGPPDLQLERRWTMWCVCSSLEINAVVAGRLVNFQPGFLGQLRAPATYSLQPPARNRVPCAAAPRKVASAANATVRITVPRGSDVFLALGAAHSWQSLRLAL